MTDIIISDVNSLREKYSEVIGEISNEVDYFIDSYKEYASYSLSSVELVEYYLYNKKYVERHDDKTYYTCGTSEVLVDFRLGGDRKEESIDYELYLHGNKNHVPFQREMMILDGLFNVKNLETEVESYVNDFNSLSDNLAKFKEKLESLGAKNPFSYVVPDDYKIEKEPLLNLVKYIERNYDKNHPLSEKEIETLNRLSPKQFEIVLNFHSNDETIHKKIIELFELFLIDKLDTYLEKNEKYRTDLRVIVLSSFNQEKIEKVKRKL